MYYRRTVREGGRRRLAVATVFVAIVLVADIVSGGFVRDQVRFAGAMVSSWAGSVGQTLESSGIFFWNSSGRENKTFAEQLSFLSERAAEADALRDENDQLRTLVHLAEKEQGMTAPVVSSLYASPYGTFLIGIGDGGNVARGDLVLTGGGFVVGQVNDTGAGTALVSETLAPGASVEAVLNGAAVLVEGQGGGNGRVQAPRGLSVVIGDAVIAPQFGQRPIGIVGAVASSSAGASQDIYIRLPSGFAGLQFVYVTPASI
ncbi:hypothetical protein HY418_02695 [Candidatus Kaiserbacteria bacterium]|nr:hypothetical protein [Candidatus Kaiserbacteria bacterium]